MKTLLVNETGPILDVTLNRPDVRNAFSKEMIEELTEVFRSAPSRPDVRAISVRGEGKAFCAGADLTYMKETASFTAAENKRDAETLHAMFETMAACPLPIATRVHGAAFGGALGLIACSDLVVAETATHYCFSEVKLGLAPAVISDFVLRKVPLGLIAPWMLTGQVFNSTDALRMGLVHFVSPAESLNEKFENCLQSFREAGPEAVRETKALIRKVGSLSPDQAREETSRVISERRVSAEGQEGLAAFFEKRTAHWRIK